MTKDGLSCSYLQNKPSFLRFYSLTSMLNGQLAQRDAILIMLDEMICTTAVFCKARLCLFSVAVHFPTSRAFVVSPFFAHKSPDILQRIAEEKPNLVGKFGMIFKVRRQMIDLAHASASRIVHLPHQGLHRWLAQLFIERLHPVDVHQGSTSGVLQTSDMHPFPVEQRVPSFEPEIHLGFFLFHDIKQTADLHSRQSRRTIADQLQIGHGCFTRFQASTNALPSASQSARPSLLCCRYRSKIQLHI